LTRLERRLYPRFDHVVAVSQQIAECLRTSGVPPSRLTEIENGIPTVDKRPQSVREAIRRDVGADSDMILAADIHRMIDMGDDVGGGADACRVDERHEIDADEAAAIADGCRAHGAAVVHAEHWAKGGAGAEALADAVVKIADSGTSRSAPLYPDTMSLAAKINTVAHEIYHAKEVAFAPGIEATLKGYETQGFGALPVCIAKTQYSFTTDTNAKGAPDDHILGVREIRLSAGAEFIVAVCGEIMTMPGLPKVPAANSIDIGPDGKIVGLF
jgi:hypothetical protein